MNHVLIRDCLFLNDENVSLQQTLREFSLVTTTEPSHSTRVTGRTVFTSTRPQQVTAPNMKDRPKDLKTQDWFYNTKFITTL